MAKKFEDLDSYNRPVLCEKCGGIMVFKGVGEYCCENCGFVAYDDYGKVRTHIEKHPGANASEVEMCTGVSQKSIRHMLKENRLEISPDSYAFLRCEACGINIRSGRLCVTCEKAFHTKIEDDARKRKKDLQGYGLVKTSDSGAIRYNRH